MSAVLVVPKTGGVLAKLGLKCLYRRAHDPQRAHANGWFECADCGKRGGLDDMGYESSVDLRYTSLKD